MPTPTISQELREWAMAGAPFADLSIVAADRVLAFVDYLNNEVVYLLQPEDRATFALLVAEALEG